MTFSPSKVLMSFQVTVAPGTRDHVTKPVPEVFVDFSTNPNPPAIKALPFVPMVAAFIATALPMPVPYFVQAVPSETNTSLAADVAM